MQCKYYLYLKYSKPHVDFEVFRIEPLFYMTVPNVSIMPWWSKCKGIFVMKDSALSVLKYGKWEMAILLLMMTQNGVGRYIINSSGVAVVNHA